MTDAPDLDPHGEVLGKILDHLERIDSQLAPQDLMSFADAAEVLHVARWTVYRWAARDEINVIRGRVPRDWVDRRLEREMKRNLEKFTTPREQQ